MPKSRSKSRSPRSRSKSRSPRSRSKSRSPRSRSKSRSPRSRATARVPLDCVYCVYGSVLDFASDDTVVVDPAGRAFTRGAEGRYTGGGMSGEIYKRYGLWKKTHTIGVLHAGDVVVNRDAVPGIRALVHAVGPDGKSKRMSKSNYISLLGTVLGNLLDALQKKRVPKRCPIALPLLSSASYAHPEVGFDEYMDLYLRAIDWIFGTSGYRIHLQLYTPDEAAVYASAMRRLQAEGRA